MFQENDLVVIKNENPTIVYVILNITADQVLLKGLIYRIIKRTSLDQLEKASNDLIINEHQISSRYFHPQKETTRNTNHTIMGTVLHIDGDSDYLESCLDFYKSMKIHAWGIYIKEKEIKFKIVEIIKSLTPDIVVITGHDAFNGSDKRDLNNYENSQEYVNIVRLIRREFSKEELIIIVGACASHFEALIASGANFASSPGRINIHTYDPAVVAVKAASTSCNKVINFESVIKHIKEGKDAFGGVETKGKMRILY